MSFLLIGSAPKESSSVLAHEALTALQDELKNPKFVSEVLPNNFCYFKQLLEYNITSLQPRTFTRSVFKLFTNLLKGCRYVNAYALSDLLESMPPLLKKSFMLYKAELLLHNTTIYELDAYDRFKQSVSHILVSGFNKNYQDFKQNPQEFLEKINREILAINEEEVHVELLRQSVIRFLEISLNKLVWSVDDKEESWTIVKKISHQLAHFIECNIITDVNDLDDLYWTLVHRYCYFLDLNSAELPLDFYQKIKHDIAHDHILLLELEEQDSFIEKKSDFFLKTLLGHEARHRMDLLNMQQADPTLTPSGKH
jgi:hypothetical protein